MEQRRREPLRARPAKPVEEPVPGQGADHVSPGSAPRSERAFGPLPAPGPTPEPEPEPEPAHEPAPAPGPGWGNPAPQAAPGAAAWAPPAYPVAAMPGPASSGPPLSTRGRRFGAYVLDAALVFVTLFIGWFVWSLVIWSKGQSPGKSLLGMRCMSTETGRAATWGTMALRELVGKSLLGTISFGITTLVSGCLILGESRKGIWDSIANTIVVDDPDGRLLG